MLSLLILMQCSSIIKLPFLLAPFHTVLWGESYYLHPTLKDWAVMLYLLKNGVSMQIIWNSSTQGFVPSFPFILFNHLFLYIWTYRYYFTFHIIIKYFIFILFLKLFHFGVSVICPTLWNLLNLLEHFFSFWHYKMHPDSFCVFPDLGSAFFFFFFPKSHGSF